MYKVIDGIIEDVIEVLTKVMAALGIYAAYELFFNIDIPIATMGIIFAAIVWVAWHLSEPDKKIEAIPVTVVTPPSGKTVPSKSIFVEGDK